MGVAVAVDAERDDDALGLRLQVGVGVGVRAAVREGVAVGEVRLRLNGVAESDCVGVAVHEALPVGGEALWLGLVLRVCV